jgi:hypothetical protein
MNLKKIIPFSFLSLLTFSFAVWYNYQQAQKNLKSASPSQFKIEMLEAPQEVQAGKRYPFVWQIDSTGSFSTTATTIYWSSSSSPSALTKTDSPQAVAYERSAPDYLRGNFVLPDKFDLDLSFDRPGPIYYRAYAKIGNDHYWTPEYHINVY